MKAKELAEILLTKPESDVCIKREYVINPHGDTDYCTKGIESIGIKDGKFVLQHYHSLETYCKVGGINRKSCELYEPK